MRLREILLAEKQRGRSVYRKGGVVGLTARVGRAIEGSADLVRDLLLSGVSVLLLGRPGVGKTTAIREISRILSGEFGRRVVVVDTSNEIGGETPD